MESGVLVQNRSSSPWEKNAPDKCELSTSPWGKMTSAPIVPCSLEKVMSEELARDLQEKEEKHRKLVAHEDMSNFVVDGSQSGDDNDYLLAQMLQHEFDQEHDTILKKEESKYNGQSKVSISFSNYRTVHPALEDDGDSDSDDEVVYEDAKVPSFSRSGIIGKGKNITTKHDPTLCSRRNAQKVMDQFPVEVDTGDGNQFDMRLNNRVYNKLKAHAVSDAKRGQRLTEKKEHSTAEHAVDPKTRLMMYKLVNAEILDHVNGVISAGKESVVFHAVGGHLEDRQVPSECAIKVFKTTLNEFKNREKYYRGDFRFADEFKKQNPRKVIKIWAEKEMMNLRRMRRFGIPCPEVVILKKHLLVMSFIGKDQRPAPKLKEVRLSEEQMQNAYTQCIEAMKTLHKNCGLVHADLSEYNILWHNGHIWFIDVSQAVDFTHPRAFEFLLRDCHNITQFFKKQGVADVMDHHDLFNEITDLSLTGDGEDFLSQIQEYEKDEAHLTHEQNRKEYAFDYFFEKSQKDKSSTLNKKKPVTEEDNLNN